MRNFWTKIDPAFKHQRVIKSTALSLAGALPLLYAALFFDVDTLERWGLIIFAFGIFMIAAGLIPYRRLVQLEQVPHQLALEENGQVSLYLNGKKTLMFPLSKVREFQYVQNKKIYGVGAALKQEGDEKVVIYDPRYSPANQQGYDLFFPYFSEKTKDRLESYRAF